MSAETVDAALTVVAFVCVPLAVAVPAIALAKNIRRARRRRAGVEVGLAGLGLVDELAEHPSSFGPVDQPDAEERQLTLDERRQFAAYRSEIESALARVPQ